MNIDVKIRKLVDNGKPLKAIASVTIDDSFALHNVRVISTDKATFIGMPFEEYTDGEGKVVRKDVFHPINSVARKAIEDAVVSAYFAEIQKPKEA